MRVLVLGSFPSAASLAARQYYAHPRNQFWRLMGDVLDEPLVRLAYGERVDRLRARGIGLFDTIIGCERTGSLDTAIRAPELARIETIATGAPRLALCAFNGAQAARAAQAWAAHGYATLTLPSSSPAHTLPYPRKLERWRALAAHLL